MATAEFVRVVKDGVTINLVNGAGNSQICRQGDEFPVSAVPEHIVEALRGGDPYTLEVIELVEKEGPEARPAATSTRGAFDPKDHDANSVLDYLRSADKEEVKRVKALERKGKKRSTVTSFKPSAQPRTETTRSGGAADPPVPQYDDLNETQVLDLMRAQAADEEFLDAVRAYEAENEGREAILSYNPADDVQAERREPSGPSQPPTQG